MARAKAAQTPALSDTEWLPDRAAVGCRDRVCRIERFQFEVSGLSAAVAHHEHRNLFGAEAALAGYATPVAGWPG